MNNYNLDPENLIKAIILSVDESFEKMLFMDAIFINNEKCIEDIIIENPVEAKILINYPCYGEFTLLAPDELVKIMVETIYVIHGDQITNKFKNDILCEVLNTISGRIMDKIIPNDITFKLGLPENIPAAIVDDNSIDILCNFSIDDSYFIKFSFCNQLK